MKKAFYEHIKKEGMVLIGTCASMNGLKAQRLLDIMVKGNARQMAIILKKWDPIMAVHIDIESASKEDRSKYKRDSHYLAYHHKGEYIFYRINRRQASK